jgi:hypothetical protein
MCQPAGWVKLLDQSSPLVPFDWDQQAPSMDPLLAKDLARQPQRHSLAPLVRHMTDKPRGRLVSPDMVPKVARGVVVHMVLHECYWVALQASPLGLPRGSV